MRSALVWACAALAIGAAGCGEKPQAKVAAADDAAAFQGTAGPYGTPGWKPGDQTSWEEHMRARAQYGQNEYSRPSGR
jgi:hypothetical protein